MTPNEVKCLQIKEYLQRLTGVEDIGTDSRKGNIPDLKKAYCVLCKEFTTASLETIASCLDPNYKHSTVIHNLKKFNDYKYSSGFKCLSEYNEAREHFKELQEQAPLLLTEKERFNFEIKLLSTKIEALTTASKSLQVETQKANSLLANLIKTANQFK